MRFRNPDPRHAPHGLWPVLRWSVIERLRGRRRQAELGPAAPSVVCNGEKPSCDVRFPSITWIGHASFLVRIGGRIILLDPVFSERIGWVYPRHGPPGVTADQLPPIDAVCVSHNHYDHLDLPSIEALPRTATVVVPAGLGSIFVKREFARVVELEWWEATTVGALRVTLVPACHWSKRRMFDTNRTLWGGFVLEDDEYSVYFAGDTAWFEGFAEIGRRFPGLDAALLPIGGYDPAWFMEHNHLNPEQAGRAFLDCGARVMLPMHWGCFALSDEPLLEPVERLKAWWSTAALPSERRLEVLAVGETLELGPAAAVR
jgi:L-ascorbate metabolism protein UlaG (beta-lactamase superfamily)